MTTPVERNDPGMQPERTLLSWQRTLILLVIVGLLFFRGELVPGEGGPLEAPLVMRTVTMVAVLVLTAVLGLHVWLRWRHNGHGVRAPDTGGPPSYVARPWAMLALCGGVLAMSCVLLATVLLDL
ncbi:DUF202 domain-containing protein [Nocardiopsis sp. ATB16-24]|uniref:DUF202 domain-containing protein n=1 Tax=Nocardiopsis sp. ATB16-24 TaxID=3019555 RepID=UPI0025577779|nr:DUF202 domain-containing protein [Nocardiopsis sp. ATB16-24]